MIERKQEPVKPAVAAGVVLLAAGLVAWLWLGDWRWAATGGAALLVCAVVSAVKR